MDESRDILVLQSSAPVDLGWRDLLPTIHKFADLLKESALAPAQN
jgi:hypothetical protein